MFLAVGCNRTDEIKCTLDFFLLCEIRAGWSDHRSSDNSNEGWKFGVVYPATNSPQPGESTNVL